MCLSHQEWRWPEWHLLCLHHDPGDDQVSQHGRCFLRCQDPPQLQTKYGGDLGKHQALPVHSGCQSWHEREVLGVLKTLPFPPQILMSIVGILMPALGWEGRQLLIAALGSFSSCCASTASESLLGLLEILPRGCKAESH